MTPDSTMIDESEGYVGYMTWQDFTRLEWAVHNAVKHIPWWRVCGHVNSRDPMEGTKGGKRAKRDAHPLPLPAPWLAAEEITRLMNELNAWPELTDAVNDLDGEDFARLLIREVETACAAWPISDRPHKVNYYRCQSCNQLTLKYFPPNPEATKAESQVVGWSRHGVRYTATVRPAVVRCTDKACRAVMGEMQWEIAARIAAHEHMERKSAS